MVPSTGYLRSVRPPQLSARLRPAVPAGHDDPTHLQPFQDYPNLVSIFREYGEWMHLLSVEDVGGLNEAIANDRACEVILVSGGAARTANRPYIAQEILPAALRCGSCSSPVPFIPGRPPSPGVCPVQLLANGIRPFGSGLDDYFADRANTPKDEDGNYDYETLQAIDLKLFNEQLLRLMDGQAVQVPHYDFLTGMREWGKTVRLTWRRRHSRGRRDYGLYPAPGAPDPTPLPLPHLRLRPLP